MTKKPRLVYYEEAESAWIFAPDNVRSIIEADQLDDGETVEISFRRVDMTDEEFENAPEV